MKRVLGSNVSSATYLLGKSFKQFEACLRKVVPALPAVESTDERRQEEDPVNSKA